MYLINQHKFMNLFLFTQQLRQQFEIPPRECLLSPAHDLIYDFYERHETALFRSYRIEFISKKSFIFLIDYLNRNK